MTRPLGADELRQLIAGGLVDPELPGGVVHLFDVRDGAAFCTGHIPGARHLPLASVLRWAPQQAATLELVVLVDEDGAAGGRARRAAAELAHRWFSRLCYLEGGQQAWVAAGQPLEQGGPAGDGAASHAGARPEAARSAAAPWRTAAAPGNPARAPRQP